MNIQMINNPPRHGNNFKHLWSHMIRPSNIPPFQSEKVLLIFRLNHHPLEIFCKPNNEAMVYVCLCLNKLENWKCLWMKDKTTMKVSPKVVVLDSSTQSNPTKNKGDVRPAFRAHKFHFNPTPWGLTSNLPLFLLVPYGPVTITWPDQGQLLLTKIFLATWTP